MVCWRTMLLYRKNLLWHSYNLSERLYNSPFWLQQHNIPYLWPSYMASLFYNLFSFRSWNLKNRDHNNNHFLPGILWNMTVEGNHFDSQQIQVWKRIRVQDCTCRNIHECQGRYIKWKSSYIFHLLQVRIEMLSKSLTLILIFYDNIHANLTY